MKNTCWMVLVVALAACCYPSVLLVVVEAFQQPQHVAPTTRTTRTSAFLGPLVPLPLTNTPWAVSVPSSSSTRLFQASSGDYASTTLTKETETTTTTETETTTPLLTDVDARVLESILREEKVDLRTEDGIRKLLERGTVKTALLRPDGKDEADQDHDQEEVFSSTVIKTLTDTMLWKKVSVKASDWLETLTIWVANKVEQDVKVLAALGLFAWDRAVRDVARALPEAGSTTTTTTTNTGGRQMMLLSNSSSFQATPLTATKEKDVRAIMEDMNKPSEEIREVTRSILKILSGETTRTRRPGAVMDPIDTTGSSDRGLRTAAPAGTIYSGERMRRAYQQYKNLDRKSKDVTRIPGAVVDTAFELKRELTAEASRPGYKTESIRNAIGAGVAETSRMLSQVKEGARLAAAKKKALRLKEAQQSSAAASTTTAAASSTKLKSSLRDDTIERLRLERSAIAQRLRSCIKEPENTWLREEVILASETQIHFDQEALRDVVMTMMLVRDEIEAKQEEEQQQQQTSSSSSYEVQLLEDIKSIRGSLEDIRGRAAAATSYGVAEALWEVVIGAYDSSNSNSNNNGDVTEPLLLKLDEIESLLNDTSEVNNVVDIADAFYYDEDDEDMRAASFFADNVELPVTTTAKEETSHRRNAGAAAGFPVIDILDVIPEPVLRAEFDAVFEVDNNNHNLDSSSPLEAVLATEIVSNDDYEVAVGTIPRRVFEVSEEKLETEESKDAMMMFTLRLLDIIFFVFEKTCTVAIPKSVLIAETFSRRYMEINRGGKGSTGWQQVRNAANARGRY